MGRTSDAKERLIESATALIHERGYAGVGVSEICSRAGVKKGSFYHFFTSKQTLGCDVIDAYWQALEPAYRAAFSGDEPPLVQLSRFLTALHANHSENQCENSPFGGCLLGNLALEMSTQDDQLRARIAEIFAIQSGYFEDVVRRAVTRGDIPRVDAKIAGRTILAYIEGLVMLAKVEGDAAVLADASAEVMRILGASSSI